MFFLVGSRLGVPFGFSFLHVLVRFCNGFSICAKINKSNQLKRVVSCNGQPDKAKTPIGEKGK